MKALFLANTVTPALGGRTKAQLVAVNGIEGYAEMQPGSADGKVLLDTFLEDHDLEPGGTYVLELRRYKGEEAEKTATATATDTTEAEPETATYEGVVEITTVGSKVVISVNPKEEAAAETTAAESEETADTQPGRSADAADKSQSGPDGNSGEHKLVDGESAGDRSAAEEKESSGNSEGNSITEQANPTENARETAGVATGAGTAAPAEGEHADTQAESQPAKEAAAGDNLAGGAANKVD